MSSTKPISAEEVSAEVRRFWDVCCSKSKIEYERFYLPDATVFAPDTVGSADSARLMLPLKIRELFAPTSSASAKLGPVEVQILEPGLAVACYGLHHEGVRTRLTGKRIRFELPWALMTQVFQRDDQGKLRIIHEHLSAATRSTIEPLDR
jgi:ketosteroid isomerase-like protein